MKRIGHLFEAVASFPNLLLAFQKAKRGKGGRASVERFARCLEPELFRLQDELFAGSYRPGTPSYAPPWLRKTGRCSTRCATGGVNVPTKRRSLPM